MPRSHPQLAELEATLAQGSGSQRFSILQRMTDLFLAGSDGYSDEHIAIFDELFGRLIETIERQALIELSSKLAPIDRAPVNVVGRLSRNDDVAISGPLLEQSNVLTDDDLFEIATTRSQAHLLAIAGRKRIGEPVADVLIDRGNAEVAQKVTSNAGARFSRFGLALAVRRAETEESLAVAVANREDLPPDLLDHLVRKATTAVRQRLLANAKPEMKPRITQVLSAVSSQIARSVGPNNVRPPAAIRQDSSRRRNRILQCVESHDTDGLIDALAIHCEVPIKAVRNIVRQESDHGMLVLAKASGLSWPELQGVLSVILPQKTKTPDNLKTLFADFVKLTPADAQRAIRFIRVRPAYFRLN